MNTIRLAEIILFLGLVPAVTQAATFTLYNKGASPVYVRPIWSGRDLALDHLQPGQSKYYDSSLNNITAIRWAEVVPVKEGGIPIKGQMLVKSFEASIKLGAWNVLGKFEILNSGSYSYYFGVDGSDNSSAAPVDGL